MRLRLIYAFTTRCAISMSEMEDEWNCCNTRDRDSFSRRGDCSHSGTQVLDPSSDRAGNFNRFPLDSDYNYCVLASILDAAHTISVN